MIWDGKQVIYLVDTKSYEVGRKQAKIGICKVKKCPTLRGKPCSGVATLSSILSRFTLKGNEFILNDFQ